jgi:hypothetical protein
MQEGGMSIQSVLQVVARLSTLSDEHTCLEEQNTPDHRYLRANVVATLVDDPCFMQDSELPITRILGNPVAASIDLSTDN